MRQRKKSRLISGFWIKLPLSEMEKTVDGAGHFAGEGVGVKDTSSSTVDILSLKCLLNIQVRFQYTVRHTCLAIMGGFGAGDTHLEVIRPSIIFKAMSLNELRSECREKSRN